MADRKARYERRQAARGRRGRESRRDRMRNLRRTLLIGAGGLVVVAAVVGVLVLLVNNTKNLPPTGFGPGHLESFPPRQINNVPVPRPIQEHVMERGGGHHTIGNMMVQYNCDGYECESGAVDKLIEIVQSYPPNVYLAPYPGMDAMIALTSPGRRLVLDSLDETRIRAFLTENLNR